MLEAVVRTGLSKGCKTKGDIIAVQRQPCSWGVGDLTNLFVCELDDRVPEFAVLEDDMKARKHQRRVLPFAEYTGKGNETLVAQSTTRVDFTKVVNNDTAIGIICTKPFERVDETKISRKQKP